jgi:hypothetical protein
MPRIADLAADPEVKPIMDLELQDDHSAEQRQEGLAKHN